MNKKEIFTFRGLNQDFTKSKHPKEFYYEGNNIRISATDSQSTGSVTNEKGTVAVLSVPSPSVNVTSSTITYGEKSLQYKGLNSEITAAYTGETSGEQIIIGHTIARNNIVLFTTDDNGFDCIWEITEENDEYILTLRYMRNLSFSTENPIQAIYNFENDRIQKVYWVDGENQLRFLNLRQSVLNKDSDNLIDVNSNTINIVGTFKISQPKITDIVSGGNHTAGMIQYAYNLYRLNSSQTKLSPLSSLVPLTKGASLGGGAVNEVVGTTPIVEIDNIDPEYTHIKVYAIKYTSYNQTPSISLIKDQELGSRKSLTVFDDGNAINDISLAEFRFLGSDPIVPKHIESKDNILFSANIKEENFDIKLDTRAYAFNAGGVAKIHDNVVLKSNRITGISKTVNPSTYIVDSVHDSVNIDYNLNKFQSDGITLGGEGKYVKYELVQNEEVINPETKTFFKDNEIYRLGLHFYNRLGQTSLPKWIADIKAPEGNLEGKYNTLKVTLKPEFYVWLNTSSNFDSEDDKPVGYRVLRANRTLNDRTIINQGFLNGFMSNFRAKDKTDNSFTDRGRTRTQDGNKMPSLQRVFAKHSTQMEGLRHGLTLGDVNSKDNQREVPKASSSDYWIAETFQYNVLMQMFSPEALFSSVSLYEGLELKVKGALENENNSFWGQEREASTKNIIREGKVLNGLTPHEDITQPNTGETGITGDINDMADKGIYGAANAKEDTTMDFFQFYRNFNGTYRKASGKKYPVYGKPELSEKGQGALNYNGDPNFKFYNSLEPMLADGGDSNKGENEDAPSITSVNSWGAKCVTVVLGPNDSKVLPIDRPKLETLWSQSGISQTNVMLIAELVKNKVQIYLGGIYGGNSYEDKKRTNYIEIGDYNNILSNISNIVSPGDTFVQDFRFAKLTKTDTEVYSATSKQFTEIVEGRIETTVDLNNRNDISSTGWDSRFQPRETEYHEYNRVYSQQPTLLQRQDVDYNFRKVNNFDTRIMASKVKVPGEPIDNWTDLLVNEVQDLNGKHGPINSLVSFKDNIYALQDKAIAYVAINPRVQVQGTDGIEIELGAGKILHDYKYVSTNSGTLNKWAVASTQYGIYYLDTDNKCFNRFTNKVEKLSDAHGLHTWFQTKIDYNRIKEDNPILDKGAHIGYDLVNNCIMLTINQGAESYTRMFNEARNAFIGLMDYKPAMYIVKNAKLLSVLDKDFVMYEHFKGKYNHFYGHYYPSYITLLVNPAVNYECVFNNIEFNSELYLDDIDQSDKTLTHIQAYNEYQDSGKIPLVLGRSSNLRRKFRTWRAEIPRDKRARLRNPWIFLKLELDNEDNYKLILHDIVVDYTIS